MSDSDGAYYHITGSVKVKSSEINELNWPHFYIPNRYYLGIKKNIGPTWNIVDGEIKADDFDSIALCKENTLKEALIAAEVASINNNGEFVINANIGYKFLYGIEIDPKASSYTLVDANLVQEPVVPEGNNPGLLVDGTYIKKASIKEDADPVYVYEYAGQIEALQNCEEFIVTSTTTKDNPDFNEELEESETNPRTIEEIVEQKYVRYLGCQYSAKYKKGENTYENLDGLKTLDGWRKYIENQGAIENPKVVDNLVLTKEERLVPELVKPSYSLENAVIMSNLEDFDGEYSNYYYYVEDGNNQKYSRLTKSDITQFYKNGEGQARANWFSLTFSNAFIYYNLSDEYYISSNEDYLRVTNQTIAGFEDVSGFKKIHWEPQYVFIPNTYYKKVGDKYELASTYNSETDYYRYPDQFVISDSNNIYAKGARWNQAVTPVPSAVTVGYKNYVWELRELPGFADQINTMHGLILKINKMLLDGDIETRDRATVQGAINTLNDIIDKFDQLVPAEIAMVDAYGRVHTGDWDSKQKLGYTNIGKPSASQAVPAGDPEAADNERWVKLTTTPGIAPDFKPHIKLEHTLGHSAAPTTTTADKNHDGLIGNGLNATHGDTIDLYTPIVDNTGHVIGKNTETVTLPYGFKTVSIGAQSTEVYNTTSNSDSAVAGTTLDKSYSGNGNLIADNTQDILAINTGNKWIRIKNDISDSDGSTLTNDGFTISHEVHSINISDSIGTNINDFVDGHINDTINIPDWDYDNAGHIIEKHNHEYILPYGFKKVGVKNTTAALSEGVWNTTLDSDAAEITADNSQDIVNVEADEWINITTTEVENNDKLVFTHRYPYREENTTSSSNLNNPLSNTINLETVVLDSVGHVKHVNTETVTLPYGFKTITGNNGSLVADNTQDTVVFSGDTWIQTTASSEGVTIRHIGPGEVTHTTISNKTPDFGEPFTIVDWTFDERGHKAAGGQHTVTIPIPTLNDSVSGDIITALAWDINSKGRLNVTGRSNIGDLLLTGYPSANSDNSIPAATDSLNTAIKKLSHILNDEATQINTRIANAKAEVKGASTDESTAETILGTRKLAQALATAAEQSAKTYADGLASNYEPVGTVSTTLGSINYTSYTYDGTNYVAGTATTKTLAELVEIIAKLDAKLTYLENNNI